MPPRCASLVALLLLAAAVVVAAGDSHRYKEGDAVKFFVNKVGPYSNPSETYWYYDLPFCQPDEVKHQKQSLGQALEGDVMASSLYALPFRVQQANTELCTVELDRAAIDKFKRAIEHYYYFEMNYDALPLRGFIGTMNRNQDGEAQEANKRWFLFKHLIFTVLYNDDRVIGANVTADLRQVQELKDDERLSVAFSYSVKWIPTDIPFEKRVILLTDPIFRSGELEIHWLSIMNSFVLVILLTGFIAVIILRVLKSDLGRYNRADEEDDGPEDYGWKLIHGDVFRFPPYPMLLASLLGNGAQFLLLTILILSLAVIGIFYPGSEGNIRTAAIIIYALTAGVSGYVSASFYKQLNGAHWSWNIMLTTTLFAVPFIIIAAVVNGIASSYDATSEMPTGAITLVLVIWLFVGFPLTVLGGITGKRMAGSFDAPMRTRILPREIPPIAWYRQAPVQMLMAGFLPFSAIYIELYYIYASVWGHAHYTLYGILFLVFIILLIVTSCITIALTYFQLSMEDHRWWWRSFLSGGSTGLFVYMYSVFWYTYRSRMSGALQAAFFFGYMAAVCYFFFMMLGAVGFYSSLTFVRYIYQSVKVE